MGALVDDLKTSTLEDGGNRTSFWLRRGPELPDPVMDDLPPPLT